ncbi:MAG: ABC transporter permease [Candidatus Marinimicrobia bacterium]|nr:ABC transporter permease [Candidatus Neomarinimicrobiota bacterium]
MFVNYLKIAIRNLKKYKQYSIINVLGLTIGITACVMILLYVNFQRSFDRYHENADRIYRIETKASFGGMAFNGPVTCAPMAETLQREFPEVVKATRVFRTGYPVLRYADKAFSEERWFAADSTFFEMFSIPFIDGDPKTALTKPNNVVITESMAKKYFGNEPAVGKVLNSDKQTDYMVTGVVKDIPANSHFHFDFLCSINSYQFILQDQFWLSNNYFTYILLKENASAKALEEKLPSLIPKYIGPQILQTVGRPLEQVMINGNFWGYYLTPLTDIHLHANSQYELEPGGNASYVAIFVLIAIFILVIACINFMNLATARSATRAKEVGIRKTLGSGRSQLIRQFLAESIFLSLLSVILAMILVKLLLPAFNNMVGTQIEIHYFNNFIIFPLLIALGLAVGFLAGIYPAFFLAAFDPVVVLKGNLKLKSKHSWLRSTLVVFQFVISIVLFSGALIIFNQLKYIQNKNLGFNKEQVIVVEKTDDIGAQVIPFKEQLLRNPDILSVSNSNTIPGRNFSNNAHRREGATPDETVAINGIHSDTEFAETYQMTLVAGRYFSKDRPADSGAVVLNEAAVKAFGIEEPVIGKGIMEYGPPERGDIRHEIIGVVKDFHYQSLHYEIRPLAIELFQLGQLGRCVSVRVKPENIRETIAYMEKTWKEFASDQAFEYVFFDEDFARLYRSEQDTRKIVTIFSGLAIFIACLGLFGLASFTIVQRTKEIGIRKALGASVRSIFLMLSLDTLKLVLIAMLVSFPISWLIMSKWLQNFSYRISYDFGAFLLAGFAAFIIAIGTVSHQAIRAATSNPVDALKYE